MPLIYDASMLLRYRGYGRRVEAGSGSSYHSLTGRQGFIRISGNEESCLDCSELQFLLKALHTLKYLIVVSFSRADVYGKREDEADEVRCGGVRD